MPSPAEPHPVGLLKQRSKSYSGLPLEEEDTLSPTTIISPSSNMALPPLNSSTENIQFIFPQPQLSKTSPRQISNMGHSAGDLRVTANAPVVYHPIYVQIGRIDRVIRS